MTNHEKIINRIKKCLALAHSSNEHEAAAALRQAQKMIEQYGIRDTQLLAAGVGEKAGRAGSIRTPARWESYLISTIKKAFACEIIFARGCSGSNWLFIGVGANAEIAQYAYKVLFRQLRKARQAFIKTHCKRLNYANKTRRADLYCDGWVNSVYEKVVAMAISPEGAAAINAYLLERYPTLTNDLQTRDRNTGRKMSERDIDALVEGYTDGQQVNLSRDVGTASPALIGG